MLPVFVDHILYPTITTAGFVTEVHHITGKGENAGVVYSEMQGRENQSGDLMALEWVALTLNDTWLTYQNAAIDVPEGFGVPQRDGWSHEEPSCFDG